MDRSQCLRAMTRHSALRDFLVMNSDPIYRLARLITIHQSQPVTLDGGAGEAEAFAVNDRDPIS